MRFPTPRIPQINPKAFIPDPQEFREKIAQRKSRDAETERVSTAPGADVGEKEIAPRIADLDVMVREAPQRVFAADSIAWV